MKKSMFLFTFITLVSGFTYAENILFEIRGNYFFPAGTDFKDIYKGGLTYGGDICVRILKPLEIWAGASVFSKKGELSFSGEETKLTIVPLSIGLKARVSKWGFHYSAAMGLSYFLYKESNPIGTVEGGKIGYLVELGIHYEISQKIFLGVKIHYSLCETKPADYKVHIGGLETGIGIMFLL